MQSLLRKLPQNRIGRFIASSDQVLASVIAFGSQALREYRNFSPLYKPIISHNLERPADVCLQSPVNAILKVIIGIFDQTKADSVRACSGQGPYICCQVLASTY